MTLSLAPKDLRGSRLGCLLLTSGSPTQVANRINAVASPYATVDEKRDFWMPRGLLDPGEADLNKTGRFLTPEQRQTLRKWWLVHSNGARTPVWDLVSTADLDGRPGLILFEAKSHASELSEAGKPLSATASKNSRENDAYIRNAIEAASASLNALLPGWQLSCDRNYQLSNRFAWGWKLASVGIPVVLVYLGFLNADEMLDQGMPFRSANQWREVLLKHTEAAIPLQAWEQALDTGAATFRAVLRAAELQWEAGKPT